MGDKTIVDVAAAGDAARELTRTGMDWTDTWEGWKGQLEAAGTPADFGNDALGQQLYGPYASVADQLKPNGGLPGAAGMTFGDGASDGVRHIADQDAANGRSMPG